MSMIINPYRFGSSALSFGLRNKGANVALSGANLIATGSAGNSYQHASTQSAVPGLNYIELVLTSSTPANAAIGVVGADFLTGNIEYNWGAFLLPGSGSGDIYYRGSGITNIGGAAASGDVISIAWTTTKVWFRKNGGNWNGNAAYDPAANTGGVSIHLSGPVYVVARLYTTGDVCTLRPTPASWSYSPPTGFGAPVAAVLSASTGVRWLTPFTGHVIDERLIGVGQGNGTEGITTSTLITNTPTYCELLISTIAAANLGVGLAVPGTVNYASYLGSDTSGVGYYIFATVLRNGGSLGSGESYADGNRICIAFNSTKVWFRKNNGNWNNSGSDNPATNTGGFTHSLTAPLALATRVYNNGDFVEIAAPSSTWLYSAPSGFVEATVSP